MTDEELYSRLTELVRSEGWKSFQELLTTRRNNLIILMLNEPETKLSAYRERIKEVQEIVNLPKQFIEEYKERKKESVR